MIKKLVGDSYQLFALKDECMKICCVSLKPTSNFVTISIETNMHELVFFPLEEFKLLSFHKTIDDKIVEEKKYLSTKKSVFDSDSKKKIISYIDTIPSTGFDDLSLEKNGILHFHVDQDVYDDIYKKCPHEKWYIEVDIPVSSHEERYVSINDLPKYRKEITVEIVDYPRDNSIFSSRIKSHYGRKIMQDFARDQSDANFLEIQKYLTERLSFDHVLWSCKLSPVFLSSKNQKLVDIVLKCQKAVPQKIFELEEE